MKPKRVVRRKLTAPVTGPCVSSATEEEEVDEVFAAAQLVDLSIDVKPESSGELQSKSAAQIFMEEKQEQVTAKKMMTAKLALLEKEVALGQHLLHQNKTLLHSKKALLMRKVRVTYNKCHKLWRGKVVSAHKSHVDEQVAAAKARLGLTNTSKQFNIPAMVALIEKLAPEGKSCLPSLPLCILRLQGLGGGDLLTRRRSHVCATLQLQFPLCPFGSVARGLHIQLQQCNQGTEVT